MGRGNHQGITPTVSTDLFVEGNNLTSTKARMLLMACLLKLGSLPVPADLEHPTDAELDTIRSQIAAYQAIFDTH